MAVWAVHPAPRPSQAIPDSWDVTVLTAGWSSARGGRRGQEEAGAVLCRDGGRSLVVCAGLRGLHWLVGIRQAPPNQEEAQCQHVVGQANV